MIPLLHDPDLHEVDLIPPVGHFLLSVPEQIIHFGILILRLDRDLLLNFDFLLER